MALSAGTRRVVACVLVGLGAALLAVALLIPTYTLGKLAKTPLDLEVTTIATNDPETTEVLDSSSLTSEEGSAKVDTGVPLISQRFITVEEPSDADVMTVQVGQTLRRTDKQADTGLLSALIDRVTIDRKTGLPIAEEPNGSVALNPGEEGAEPVQHIGLQYRFPIGTEKKTYPYYDLNVRKTYDVEFVEETEIGSTPVYYFRMSVPPTSTWDAVQAPANRLSLPAEKWGVEGEGEVEMTRYYTNTRELWVEPQTGTVIKGSEQLHLYYARNAEEPEVTALKTELIFDQETVESQAAIAEENTDKMALYGRTVPILAGILGVIAIIAGLFLGLRGGGAGTPAAAGGAHRPSGGGSWDGNDDPPTTRIDNPGDLDPPTEQIDMGRKP